MRKKKKEISKPAPCLSERYSKFCTEFHESSNQIKFLFDFFELDVSHSLQDFDESSLPDINDTSSYSERRRNEDLKIIAFCKNKSVQRILLEIGDEGADIVTIFNSIKVPHLQDDELERLLSPLSSVINPEFHPKYNDMVEHAVKGQKEFKKRVRVLHGAIKAVHDIKSIRMNAVDALRKDHPDFNDRLVSLQKELEVILNLYIEHAPFFRNKHGNVTGYIASNWAIPISRMKIPKKVTSKSKLWNSKITTIVNELLRAGFSAKKAYQRTLDLLVSSFPEIWKDNDPDLIRQRYTYHTKPKK